MPTSIQPIPNIAFEGNCAEAMHFYEKALGGTIKSMMTAADSPMADQFPPEQKNTVLNAQLELPGGSMIYGGDCPPHMEFKGHHGFCLTLNYATAEEGGIAFDQLAEGGEVSMPYEPTFWADKFGMLTDKFGVSWAINGNLKSM